MDGEMLGRMLLLMLMVDVALTLAVCDALVVALDDGVAVPDGVSLDDRVDVAVLVDVRVSLAEPVEVRVRVPTGLVDGTLEGDAPLDSDDVGEAVVLGDCDADGLPVSLLVAVGAADSDSEAELEAVDEDEALAVSEDDPVMLGRGDLDGETVGRTLLLMLTVEEAVA